jgi:hypothetical protein
MNGLEQKEKKKLHQIPDELQLHQKNDSTSKVKISVSSIGRRRVVESAVDNVILTASITDLNVFTSMFKNRCKTRTGQIKIKPRSSSCS